MPIAPVSVASRASAAATPQRDRWCAGLLLVLLTLAAHAPALAGGFVLDDAYLVADNPAIRELWSIPRFFVETPPGSIVSNFYRPVLMASFAMNHAVLGPGPAGFHGVNLALHALAGLLVMQILWRLGVGTWAAFGGALVFGLHPLQAETVDVINYRSTSLAAVFLFGALAFYLRVRREPWRFRHTLVLGGLYFGSVASKEIGITLPALLLACDLLLAERSPGRRQAYASCLAVAGLYLVLRQVICEPQDAAYFRGRSWVEVALTMTVVEAYALSLVVAPRSLSTVYDMSVIPHVTTPLDPRWLWAAALLGLLAVLAVRGRRRRPLLSLAVVLYFVGLAPTTQVLGRLPVLFGERFLYVALLGVALAVGLALQHAFAGRARAPAIAALVSVALCLGGYSFLRGFEFRSDTRVWSAAVATRPRSVQAHAGFANALRAAGACREALSHFDFVLQRVDPGAPGARVLFGSAASCFSLAGDNTRALQIVEAWLARHPADSGFTQMRARLGGGA